MSYIYLVDDDVFTDVGQDVVAFLLVVIEEEPKGLVGMVGGGDVAAVAVQLGVGHHLVAFRHGFLVGFVGIAVHDAVALGEVFFDDVVGDGVGHHADVVVVTEVFSIIGDGAVAHDDGCGGHE